MIPKIIWTFWDTEEVPEFIQKCIETWKHYNSDYEINMINMNNYKKYISTDITKWKFYNKTNYALISDYIRICVLKEHGGIWMDASIICIKPIKFKNDTEFFAYYMNNNGILGKYEYPVIESWFLATTINNTFINELYEEFIINTNNYYSTTSYVLLSGIKLNKTYFIGYFAVYIALLKTLIKLDRENRTSKIVLKHAGIDGPFVIVGYQGNLNKILCDTDLDKLKTPLIKITGVARKNIISDKKTYDCIINKIEHFDEDKYMEDLGYNDLDGYKHKYSEILSEKLCTFILLLIIILIIMMIIIVILKNRLK
jgi:hypothetical protein